MRQSLEELLALKHIAGSKANFVLKTRLSGTTYVKILMYLKRVLANFLSMKRDNGSTRMEINPSVFFETQMLNRCRKCSFTTTPNQVRNLQKEDLHGVRERKSVEVVYLPSLRIYKTIARKSVCLCRFNFYVSAEKCQPYLPPRDIW